MRNKLIIIYIAIMCTISLIQMGSDKIRARKGKWRISERTLLLTAALGGSYGGLLGMHMFHHKTKHKAFSLGLPVMVVIHSIVLGFILFFT